MNLSRFLSCALLWVGTTTSVDAFLVGVVPPTSSNTCGTLRPAATRITSSSPLPLSLSSCALAAAQHRRCRTYLWAAEDVVASSATSGEEGDAAATTLSSSSSSTSTDSAATAPAPAVNGAFRTSSSSSSTTTTNAPPRQALYGTTLDYPSSYVRCGKCEAIYALHEDDLGRGRGRRLECAVCQHSWFQSKDRLMTVKPGEFEMIPMPQRDLTRIQHNIAEGKAPKFVGHKKLYVGNVAFECHEDDLFEIFGKMGEVGDVSLVRDEEGKNRGFGFITMRTDAGGEKAIAELDGLAVRGRNIAVRESNS